MMAAGTGGHVFPALAVAKVLESYGVAIHWLGTKHGMEGALVQKQDYPFYAIDMQGLRGHGLWRAMAMPAMLTKAVLNARHIIKVAKIDAVVGFGGYVTVPGGLAAKWCRCPLIIHEQNAIAGMSNQQLARFADTVMQAFDGAFASSVLTVGNPVREEILAIPAPNLRYDTADTAPLKLLAVGGSLGALAINEAVVSLLQHNPNLCVRHQCGSRNLDTTQALYNTARIDPDRYRLMPFIDDMAAAYAWADVVLCRAGALTVSEIAAAGAAAIFVPLPSAVDDHQTMNARYLTERGAGILLPQNELKNLADVMKDLDRERCLIMAQKAKDHAVPNAAQQAAQIIRQRLGDGSA